VLTLAEGFPERCGKPAERQRVDLLELEKVEGNGPA
jgi:hypothetical protein